MDWKEEVLNYIREEGGLIEAIRYRGLVSDCIPESETIFLSAMQKLEKQIHEVDETADKLHQFLLDSQFKP